MKMLLYDFSLCEAMNIMFWNMFIEWVPESFFAHQTQALRLGIMAQCCFSPRTPLSCEFFLLSMYSLQVPKRILQINFELSHFNMSTKVKVVLYPEFSLSAIDWRL
uniref:Uncharacterized protein n=1 Tax=Oryctolagus cuniculus TaxID=9986 RepID=A0A5F9C0M9_RABIT